VINVALANAKKSMLHEWKLYILILTYGWTLLLP